MTGRLSAADYFGADEFTLAHRDFCRDVAAEFIAAGAADSGDAWYLLGHRIEKVLVGEWAQFTPRDSALVKALHVATLRAPLAEGAKERSRMLAQIGLLVFHATRGRLPQLHRKAE